MLTAASSALSVYPPMAATLGPMLQAWGFMAQVLLAYALAGEAPKSYAAADVLLGAAPLAAVQGLPALGGSADALVNFYKVRCGGGSLL